MPTISELMEGNAPGSVVLRNKAHKYVIIPYFRESLNGYWVCSNSEGACIHYSEGSDWQLYQEPNREE